MSRTAPGASRWPDGWASSPHPSPASATAAMPATGQCLSSPTPSGPRPSATSPPRRRTPSGAATRTGGPTWWSPTTTGPSLARCSATRLPATRAGSASWKPPASGRARRGPGRAGRHASRDRPGAPPGRPQHRLQDTRRDRHRGGPDRRPQRPPGRVLLLKPDQPPGGVTRPRQPFGKLSLTASAGANLTGRAERRGRATEAARGARGVV